MSDPKTGAELIAAERARQMTTEGYDAAHDDGHTDGSLALAAVCYATPETLFVLRDAALDQGRPGAVMFCDPWPWARSCDRRPCHAGVSLVPPTLSQERVRLLVKAGALIAAEIDRIQRRMAQPLLGCAADDDGDCNDTRCPQNRDGEPAKSGRHCPLDQRAQDEE